MALIAMTTCQVAVDVGLGAGARTDCQSGCETVLRRHLPAGQCQVEGDRPRLATGLSWEA